MWTCTVEAMLLAASVSFLSPAMLNPNRNKTSTCYKAIVQFWRLSIANQGKSNIDKNTCEPSNLLSLNACTIPDFIKFTYYDGTYTFNKSTVLLSSTIVLLCTVIIVMCELYVV